MPVHLDFGFSRFEDGALIIELAPPVAVGGWPVEFVVEKRQGSASALRILSAASGFNGTSGVTVVNSGQGVFRVAYQSIYTSGTDFGNYAFSLSRLSSGARTKLTTGFFTVNP